MSWVLLKGIICEQGSDFQEISPSGCRLDSPKSQDFLVPDFGNSCNVLATFLQRFATFATLTEKRYQDSSGSDLVNSLQRSLDSYLCEILADRAAI